MSLRASGQESIKQGTNLFDLLIGPNGPIDPAKAKIHLATVNRAGENPLDVFLGGGFQQWQSIQSKLNFRLPYIVSLIKIARHRWLFAGVYSTDQRGTSIDAARHPKYKYQYKTKMESAGADFIGRLIVKYERYGQQPYRLGKSCGNELLVEELRAQRLTWEECEQLKRESSAPSLVGLSGRILHQLVQHVFDHDGRRLERIPYEDLGARLGQFTRDGRGWGRNLGPPLTVMSEALDALSASWRPIPRIQCIVVKKQKSGPGLPSIGITDTWPDFFKLTAAEKEDKVRLEIARIVEFGTHWNEVLRRLELPAATVQRAARGHGQFGAGGESPQHKALKLYVRDNPWIVGASNQCERRVEHVLPSLDEIDVFFKSRTECVAVEVKSSVSAGVAGDYERGIYQAIKYLALLQAMSLDRKRELCKNIRSVLVLEGKIPPDMRELAELLSVTVKDNVVPDAKYLKRVLAELRKGKLSRKPTHQQRPQRGARKSRTFATP